MLRYGAALFGLLFIVFALAGPRWGTTEQVIERRGIDIVVALDLSKSMQTADITPNRLERAKLELSDFIDSRRGDRIGIVAFAGRAVVACPLTMDYGAAKNFLRGLSAGMIPAGGTNLSGAIEVSMNLMKGYGGREKVVVILTDGEDTLGDPAGAAKEAAEKGVNIFTIGFGTKNGGPIPVYDKTGKVKDYRRDRSGKTVISRFDAASLERIASAGGGASFVGASAVSRLAAEIEKRDKSLISSKLFTLLEERFQYPLFFAFLCFLLEGFVVVREKR